jgi:membrane protease YdiL (CAAX protease family)
MQLALSPAAQLFAGVMAAVSAGALVLFGTQWLRRGPLPAHEPRQPAPWTAADVLVVLSVFVFLQLAPAFMAQRGASPQAAAEPASPAEQRQTQIAAILAASAVSLLVCTLALAVLRFRAGATLTDLGLVPSRLAGDVALGVAAFLVVALPVYGVQSAAQWLFEARPHRIVELLVAAPDRALFAACFVSAAVVAPIVEEILFRLVLQGWLEAAETRADAAADPLAEPKPAWLSLVVPALAFAGMHMGAWPDPIPLFLFGLALGWLYRRMHRLVPCIVLHAALNAASMTLLGLSLPWR